MFPSNGSEFLLRLSHEEDNLKIKYTERYVSLTHPTWSF